MTPQNCVCVPVFRSQAMSLIFTNLAMNVTSLEVTPTLQLLFTRNCSHSLTYKTKYCSWQHWIHLETGNIRLAKNQV